MSRRPPAGLRCVPMTMPGFLLIPGAAAGISDGTPRAGAPPHGRRRRASAPLVPTSTLLIADRVPLVACPRRRHTAAFGLIPPRRRPGPPVDVRGECPDERKVAVALRV